MKYNKVLLLLVILTGFYFTSSAQDCPPNVDFELGNTSIWHYYTGTCCPINTPTATTAVANRHTLTSGTGTDPYGGFPIVAPGGNFSLRLGNDGTGSQAEKARYYVHVPAASSNFSLIYRYAVVLQDGGSSHTTLTQPRFEVKAYDSASNSPIACAQYDYNASSGLPGFTLSTSGVDVYYKSWTTASINLSGLGGTTIGIDFASGDCDLGGHFGYGYLDMGCGFFAISQTGCTGSTIQLSGPSGFGTYNWYDSATFTTLYGTTQNVNIPTPATTTTYALVILPYVGFGCPDTLYTKIIPSHLEVNASNDTTLCLGVPVPIFSNATDEAFAQPLTYSWSGGTTLSCSTCADPIATPVTGTSYVVTVTNSIGCVEKDTVTFTQGRVHANVVHTDVTCHDATDGTGSGTPLNGSSPFTYTWSSAPVQTTSTATGLPAGTYSLSIVDPFGCRFDTTVTISNRPPTVITITGSTPPTTCQGADGTITIGGFAAGGSYTITYLFNGTAQTYNATASGTGTVTIPGLAQGVYSHIGVVVTGVCTYNEVGPVTLSDPGMPAIPSMSSNSPVCEGDILNLTAADDTVGVTFSWAGPNSFTSAAQNPSINPVTLAASGVYVLTVEKHNCFATGNITVVINPLPIPSASNNAPFCAGGNLILGSSSTTGATSYSWSGPNTFSSTAQNPTINNANETYSGIYTVTVLLNNCRATATTNVTIWPIPGIPTVTDTAYCQYGTGVPLHAASDAGASILWFTDAVGGTGSATAPTPSTTIPGTFTWYVNQTSDVGCTGPRTPINVVVAPYPSPYITESDSAICTGTNVTFVTHNTGPEFVGLVWSFGPTDSVRNINPVVHGFTTAGTYPVTLTAYYDICPDTTLYLTLNVFNTPLINLGVDTSICEGSGAIELYDVANAGNPAATWVWNTGEVTPNITVVTPGNYYATVSVNGCTAADSVNILADCYVDMPNAFTPNGDGINDYFFPRQLLTKGLTTFKMELFNRWGELIFSSTSLDGNGWDGRYNGEMQPEGVFIYKIDATFKDGRKEHHQGNFTLLR